jgi:hypothetical protein
MLNILQFVSNKYVHKDQIVRMNGTYIEEMKT